VGFVVDKVALGQVFSEYFSFPCQSSFHQLLHNHPHLTSGACTIGQKWLQCQWTYSHPTNNNNNNNNNKRASERHRASWVFGKNKVYIKEGTVPNVNTNNQNDFFSQRSHAD
jgi:hypothetical protein